MIEVIIKNHLHQRLNLPVVLELQPQLQDKCVLIERTGGGERETLCTATFAVQSYAPSLLEAAQINERVKLAMRTLAEVPEVCRCQLNTDYNFTDTTTKRYRYQAVFDITYYREE